MSQLRSFALFFLLSVFVSGCPACRNPIDYALEEGVFGGQWKALQDDMVINASGNDAVVVSFGTSPMGRNSSVFKPGDKYLRYVMKTGEGQAEAEIAVPEMDGETLTGISYVTGTVQITGDQMIVTPSKGTATFWSRASAPGGNNNTGGTDGGTGGVDAGTEGWFLYGYVSVEPTIDCVSFGNGGEMENIGERARVVATPYLASYDTETDALEAELQAEYPDVESWRIWTSGFNGEAHFIMAEYFVQNIDPDCRSRKLAFGTGDTYEEALANAEKWDHADEPIAVPGTFNVLLHLTR